MAEDIVLISEGFERVWPDKYFDIDPTPGSWRLGDGNLVSEADYWGVSSRRSVGGSMSAWCAQVGNNSVNGLENRVNHYYDQGMSSFMELYVGNLFGYQTATLSFNYWAITGNSTLVDRFEVRSYDGANWRVIWGQPSVDSNGWQQASVNLPTNSSWISFYFLSGIALPGGPFEGVYVDDLTILGDDTNPPYSYLVDAPESTTSAVVELDFIASDQLGSGIAYVELFYRNNNSDEFIAYKTSSLPDGRWRTTPMVFDSTFTGGDGLYELYSIATDAVGNVESAPVLPDASVLIDSSPPETTLGISQESYNGWYSDWVMVSIEALDNTSGIATTMFAADSDVWQTYGSAFMFMTDGVHTVKVFSTDVAGNREENKTYLVKVDTTNPELSNVAVRRIPVQDNDSSAIVFWTITDDTSGLDHYDISLDGKPKVRYDSMTTWLSMEHIADGNHTLVIEAYDQAGNVLVTTFMFDTDGSGADTGSSTLLMWGGALAAVIISGAILLFLVRARRQSEEI